MRRLRFGLRPLLLAPLVLGLACATTGPPAPPSATAPCTLQDPDRIWLEDALTAWRFVRHDLLGLDGPDRTAAVFFDASCTLTTDRLVDPLSDWAARRHDQTVTLPNGDEMPAIVTSFAAPIEEGEEGDDGVFFVMSTPSVWRSLGVESDIGLETMMRAVLLHEMSHTAQFGTYGRRVTEVARDAGLGDEITDDLLQDRFADDAGYGAAMEREIDLWFEAATAPDDEAARDLARRAWDSLATRREGLPSPALAALEDLFLTLEGSGQWAGYSWLRQPPPVGPGLDRDTALTEFGRRGGYWSQSEGLALVLTLDRLDPSWKTTVFGDGSHTVLELLEAALVDGASSPEVE